jgi:hypothetical protein
MGRINNPFALQGKYRFKTFKSFNGTRDEKIQNALTATPLKVSDWISNLIMLDTNYGINLFIQHLEGTTTYPLELTRAGIGTGITAATQTDHDLQTPVLTTILRARATIEAVGELSTEWFISDDELADAGMDRHFHCDHRFVRRHLSCLVPLAV